MCKDLFDLQKKIVTKEVMIDMMSDSQRKVEANLEAMMSDSQRKVGAKLEAMMSDSQRKVESKIEAMMNSKMDGLKVDIMEGLQVLLQERHPESDNISREIHEEDT